MGMPTIILAVAVVLLIVFGVRFGTAMRSLEQRISDLEDNASKG